MAMKKRETCGSMAQHSDKKMDIQKQQQSERHKEVYSKENGWMDKDRLNKQRDRWTDREHKPDEQTEGRADVKMMEGWKDKHAQKLSDR